MTTLLTLDALLSTLSAPVPAEQVKTLKQGGSTLPYIPWYTVTDILDTTCPAWNFDVEHTVTPTQLVTKGILSILTADHGWISRSNVGIETLLEWDNKNECMREIAYGDAASNSYSMCLRRCAVLFGLGRYLYDKETAQQAVKDMLGASTGAARTQRPPGKRPLGVDRVGSVPANETW